MWELSEHGILSYYYSNMLITPLSFGQDIIQPYVDFFCSRQLGHIEQNSKVYCGCHGPHCPYQICPIHSQKSSQIWIWYLPHGNENSRFGVSKCSKCGTHPTDFISIPKVYHFTLFKGKRQKYCRQFSLAVHPVPGYEMKLFVQHYGILLEVLDTSQEPVVYLFVQMWSCGVYSMRR